MRLPRRTILVLTLLASITFPSAAPAADEPILTHREQNALVRQWIQKRFDTLLPGLMRRAGIDMWLIVSREYNEDPVFRSMSPLTTYSSRRRTILMLFDRGGDRGVERISVGRFDLEGLFTLESTPNDGAWEALRRLVEARDPKAIGINVSEAWNHADGLTANEHGNLVKELGPKYAARMKSAEMLTVGWLEVKLPEETEAYRRVMRAAHSVIRDAFSAKVITPGVTTSEDVVWWMRQRVAELGLGQWFHPSITIWRKGGVSRDIPAERRVIQRGDLLHVDFGIVYLGFSTDTQHNAYVLLPGETEAPAGIKEGLSAANRLQDLTMLNAKVGLAGNTALAATLAAAMREGITPAVYCHPIGYHGHGAGVPIGMTDYQQGVPVRGEYTFLPNTWHSIELNVLHRVKEWGNQAVRFALEEDAVLLETGWEWIDGRQTELYLIK